MVESSEHVVRITRIRRLIASPAASGTFTGRVLSAVLAIAVIVVVLVLIVPILLIALLAGVVFVLVNAAKSLFTRAKADNGILDGRRNVRVIRRD
jgi:ABC-type bacteriocin/lantibiotic exporter with double-glycine peptidase domain